MKPKTQNFVPLEPIMLAIDPYAKDDIKKELEEIFNFVDPLVYKMDIKTHHSIRSTICLFPLSHPALKQRITRRFFRPLSWSEIIKFMKEKEHLVIKTPVVILDDLDYERCILPRLKEPEHITVQSKDNAMKLHLNEGGLCLETCRQIPDDAFIAVSIVPND